jgi:hypothetical protein
MAITAAEVEAGGWVLALTIAGSLTSPATDFDAYPLSPDASPKVVLALSSPGFVKSGGEAVAGSLARSLVGMRALRKPVDPLDPTVDLLDETDLGGGLIKVRIALSEEVYTGDTGLTLAVLAGWRAGEGAASGISVTNNSAIAPPAPVFRWVLPPYQTASGAFRASMIVGSVHPVGFEPVAGVKFTATDGATVKTIWATTLATDNSYGDNLRCYTVEFDPAASPALTAGLLRIDGEVYPWLGAMRSTDPAGTKLLTNIRSDGFSLNAEAPAVIGYDPDGTRYGQLWTFIDPVNGTATASAAMVATTLAGAKAVAAASRPVNLTTAIAAIGLVNRTLAAANGQAAASRAADGAYAVLAAGVHANPGSTSISTTITSLEIPVRVIGDPEDSDPRANCILETAGTTPNLRVTRILFKDLTIRSGTGVLGGSTILRMWFDNVEIRGKSGSEAATTFPVGSTAASGGTFNVSMTKTKMWRAGYTMGGANRFVGLLRACEMSRRGTGLCMVKNRWIGKAEDGFTSANTIEGFGHVPQTATLGGLEDTVLAYNDMRSIRWTGWSATPAPAAISGVSPQTARHRRHLILNNIYERISGTAGVSKTSDTMWTYGESTWVVMDTIIIEGNTIVGGGYNGFYSDPVPATLSDVNSQTNITVRIRHANNATDRNASKHDDFSDPTVVSIRNAAGLPESLKAGYRPACIGAWSVHFGVGMEAHVDFSRSGSVNFRRDGGSGFVGLRGLQSPFATPGSPLYANDASENGSDLGGGDYTPQPGSPLLGRVQRGNSDRDFLNGARLSGGASGAIESGAITMEPATVNIGLVLEAAVLAATPSLAPANLGLAVAVAAGGLQGVAGLAGAGLQIDAAVSASVIIASLTLAPASVSIGFSAAAAGLIVAGGFPDVPPAARVIIVRGT